jgi:hypothetical protein
MFQSYSYQGTGFAQAPVCSNAGDKTNYDALGRVKTITHSDLSAINYTYTGRAVEVTDENGVSKISQADGLGRVSSVCEISASALQSISQVPCTSDIAGTGFITGYSYSLANHQTTVAQGAQNRIFITDSLGRTVSVTEPERGTTNYSYAYSGQPGLGLVVTRQRAAPNQTNPSVLTTTTYAYDSLNRLIKKSYSDGSGPVLYGYDMPSVQFGPPAGNPALKVIASLANPKGRQAWTCHEPPAQNSCISQDAFSYDSLGRVVQKWSSTPAFVAAAAPVRTEGYTFDWLGNALTASDGAGATTSYTYTPANEVHSISSSLSDATHPAQLLSNVLNGPMARSATTWATAFRNTTVTIRWGGGTGDGFASEHRRWLARISATAFLPDGGARS